MELLEVEVNGLEIARAGRRLQASSWGDRGGLKQGPGKKCVPKTVSRRRVKIRPKILAVWWSSQHIGGWVQIYSIDLGDEKEYYYKLKITLVLIFFFFLWQTGLQKPSVHIILHPSGTAAGKLFSPRQRPGYSFATLIIYKILLCTDFILKAKFYRTDGIWIGW